MLKRLGKDLIHLVLVMTASLIFLLLGTVTAYAADATIHSSGLSVVVDDTFPVTKQYTHTASGGVLYGNITGSKVIKINGTSYSDGAISVTSTLTGDDQIDYAISIPSINVVVNARFKVVNTTLEFNITSIMGSGEPNVKTIEFPDQQLISVKGTQTSPTLAYCWWRDEWEPYGVYDTIKTLNDLSASDTKSCAYAFVNNDKISAGIYNNEFYQRYITTWNSYGGVKYASLNSNKYYYRVANQTATEPLLNCKIGVFADNNSDSLINWQDAAVWYRSVSPVPYKKSILDDALVLKLVVNQVTNTGGNTFTGMLDIIKKIYNLTNGRKVLLYISQAIGSSHDEIFPALTSADIGRIPGGAAGLNYLIDQAKNYNCTVFLHTNVESSYPFMGSSGYDPGVWARNADGSPKLGWEWNEQSIAVSHTKDVLSGRRAQIYTAIHNTLPNLTDAMYIDVMLPNTSDEIPYGYPEEEWAMRKTAQILNDNGWALFNESERSYLDDYCIWSEVQTSEGMISMLDRFVKFNYYEHGAGNPGTESGAGAPDTFGPNDAYYNLLKYTQAHDLSWHHGLLMEWMEGQYLNTLPVKFMKPHSLLSIIEDYHYQTAKFADNVEAKYDKITGEYTLKQGTDFYAAKDWSVFMPQNSENEILFYSKKGTTNTWKLPSSWSSVTTVYKYKLTEFGRVADGTLSVSSNSVTISPIAKQPYVLSKIPLGPSPTYSYGTGDIVANGDFESNDFSSWTRTGPDADYSHINIIPCQDMYAEGLVNRYSLKISGRDGIAGGVQQTVSGLTGGHTYALYGHVKAKGRTAKLGVNGFGITDTYAAVTRDDIFGVPDPRITYQSLEDWQKVPSVQVVFTVPAGQTQANIYLSAEAGTSDSYAQFDHIYIREYNYTLPDNKGHLYYEGFEDERYSQMFVNREAQFGNDRWGGPASVTMDPSYVISGNGAYYKSVDDYSQAVFYNDFLWSNPDFMPLTGGKTYTVTFKYRITKQPQSGGSFFFCANRPDMSHEVGWTTFTGTTNTVYTKSITFTLDDFNDYHINFGKSYGGEIVLDDIAVDENSVVNPGFETGDKTGWSEWYDSQSSAVVESGAAYDGTYDVKYSSTSPYRQNMMQTFGKLPAGTYKLSALVKKSAGFNGVWLIIKDMGTLQEGWYALPSGAVSTWTKYETTFNITSGTAQVQLWADASNAGNLWVAFDNMKFERIDTPVTNKLTNGSFETGSTSGWTEWYPSGQGSKASVINSGAYEGSYYAKFSSTSTFAESLSQSFDVPVGLYKLSAWVKYSGGANVADMVISDAVTGKRNQVDLNSSGVPGWGKYEVTLPITSGKVKMELHIDSLNAANKWVQWDKVCLEKISDGELRNGSFESGTKSGWDEWVPNGQASKASIQSSGAHSGTYYTQCSSTTTFAQSLQQRISKLPLGTYKLSAWVKYSGGANSASIKLSDETTGQSSTVTLPSGGVSNWTKYETQLTITSGNAKMELYIDALNAANKWISWDDAVFQRVDAVNNSDFETGSKTGWYEWYPDGQGSKAVIDSSQKYDGTYSVKCSSTGTFAQTLLQNVHVPVSGTYKLSGWVYYSGGANWVYMRLHDFGGVDNYSEVDIPSAATPCWRKFETEMFIGSGQALIELYIDATNASNKWIYWDNFKLELVREATLRNGGLERGNLDYWNPTSSTSATVVNSGAHSGTYCAKLGAAGTSDVAITAKFGRNENNMISNGLYKVTMWVKYSGGAYAEIGVKDPGFPLYWANQNQPNYQLNNTYIELPSAGLANWTKYEMYIPIISKTAEVRAHLIDNTGGKSLYIDDVTFEKIGDLTADGVNLVQNHDFETGNMTGWGEWYDSASRATVQSDTPYSGNYYCKVDYSGTYGQSVIQSFSGLTNGIYKISLAYCYNGGANSLMLTTDTNDSTGSVARRLFDTAGTSEENRIPNWKKVEFYVPVNTGNLRLSMYIDAMNGGGRWVKWDDVHIEKCN